MSLENSIAELAKALNRHTDAILVLGSQPTIAESAGPISLTPDPVETPAPVEEVAAPAPAKKKAKKTAKAADKPAETVTAKTLKDYALKRVRVEPTFRELFVTLLASYSADTVADVPVEALAEVYEKAQAL